MVCAAGQSDIAGTPAWLAPRSRETITDGRIFLFQIAADEPKRPVNIQCAPAMVGVS